MMSIGSGNLFWTKMKLIDEIKEIKSTKKELREFGVVVGGVLIVIGSVLFWRHRNTYPYFLSIGSALVLLGVFAPNVLKIPQKIWMAAAVMMGFVMSREILGVLFYGVFTLIRCVSSLFGKRFLDLKIDRTRKSYWRYRKQEQLDPKRYEYQF